MSLPTQAQIDDLIQFIDSAEEAGTITNEYVATVLNFLNEKFKSGDLSIAELNSSLTTLQAALAGKASLDSDTGKLTYSQAPDVVLESMGSTLDNEGNTSIQQQVYMPKPGDTYWDSTTGRIKYKESDSTTHDLGEPNQGLVYCNKRTNLTYRWAGSSGWKQVGGAPNSSITIVNDLTTGGVEDGLSAEMGKRLKAKIEQVEGNIERLYNNLGNIAFWDAAAKAAAAPLPIDWGNPKHTVTLDLDLTNAVAKHDGVTKSSHDTILVEEGSTLNIIVEPDSGYMLTDNDISSSTAGANVTPLGNGTYKVAIVMGHSNLTLNIEATADEVPQVSVSKNLTGVEVDSETQTVAYNQPYELTLKRHKYYFPLGTYPNDETLTVTMGGTDITSSVWNASTGKISIEHVTGEVVITVTAISYVAFNKAVDADSGNLKDPINGLPSAAVVAYIKIRPIDENDNVPTVSSYTLKLGSGGGNKDYQVVEYKTDFTRNENWMHNGSERTFSPKSNSYYVRVSMQVSEQTGDFISNAYLKFTRNGTTKTIFSKSGLSGVTVLYNGVETTFPEIVEST